MVEDAQRHYYHLVTLLYSSSFLDQLYIVGNHPLAHRVRQTSSVLKEETPGLDEMHMLIELTDEEAIILQIRHGDIRLKKVDKNFRCPSAIHFKNEGIVFK